MSPLYPHQLELADRLRATARAVLYPHCGTGWREAAALVLRERSDVLIVARKPIHEVWRHNLGSNSRATIVTPEWYRMHWQKPTTHHTVVFDLPLPGKIMRLAMQHAYDTADTVWIRPTTQFSPVYEVVQWYPTNFTLVEWSPCG